MKYQWVKGVVLLLILTLFSVTLYLKATKITLINGTYELEEDGKLTFSPIVEPPRFCSPDFSIEQMTSFGQLSVDGPELTYQPSPEFFGKDEFRFHVNCWFRSSSEALVKLIVHPVNDPPVAESIELETLEDESLSITLRGLDKDGDPIKYSIVTLPMKGLISGESPHLKYQPFPDFSGRDEFTYIVSDGNTSSEPAEIKIHVVNVNDPPKAGDQTYEGLFRTEINLQLNVSDPDNTELQFMLVDSPRHGAIFGEYPELRYFPGSKFIGKDRFRFQISDGELKSDPAVIEVMIRPLSQLSELESVLESETTHGGIAVGNTREPEIVIHSKQYIPASLLKLATALAAMDQLGSDYHFQTEIYINQDRDLFIKGYGDPSLTTEEWQKIVSTLVKKELLTQPLRNIVLDDTAFEKNQEFDGRSNTINWFDAPLGPLVSNYNTAKIVVQSDRTITSWHHQSPITETIIDSAKGLPRGFHHLSIVRTPDEGSAYSGELVKELLKQKGVLCSGKISLGTVPPNLSPVLLHESSHDLKEVVKEMLLYSNNFIANQLLMVMAIDMYGEPVNLGMGVTLLKDFLRSEVQLKNNEFHVIEGSGLSRENRISLLAMFKLLHFFKPYQELMPALRQSKFTDLHRLGKNRQILAKTGTLNNVSTIAGYIYTRDSSWMPFVIMLENGQENRSELLEILIQFYQG